MKKLLVIALLATIVTSCKKTPNEAPKKDPVLTKLTSFSDRTGVSPKNGDTLGMFDFYTGTRPELFIISATLSIHGKGAFNPTTGLTNLIFYEKLQNNKIEYTSENKTSVANENLFPSLGKNQLYDYHYNFIIKANVLSAATDGVGLDDECIVSLQIEYIDANKHRGITTVEFGQKTTFGTSVPVVTNSTLETLTDPAMPSIQKMARQQEKSVLSWLIRSSSGKSSIVEQSFLIEGPGALAVSSLKVYDSTSGVLIAQAPVISGACTVIGLAEIAKDQTKRFVVRATVDDVWSAVSSLPFRLVRDKIKYQSASGEMKSIDTDLVGNNVYIFKALFSIAYKALPTTLVNGKQKLYEFAITGSTAHKQFTYEMILNDLGVNDTIFAKDFDLEENGASVKYRLRFTDANGIVDSIFTESDTKLYVTYKEGDGESVVINTKIYSFFATISGFKRSNDGDGIAIRLLGDSNIPPETFKFLNDGTIVASYARLFSESRSNIGAQSSHFLWSEFSATPHNGQFVVSTNDWTNAGLFFKELPWQYFFF